MSWAAARKLVILGAVAAACAAGVSSAGFFTAATAPALEDEIRAFERADARNPTAPGMILLAGSSSFRLWTNAAAAFGGAPVLNRGFGGSTMLDLVRHFDSVVGSHAPSVVVVYEGDNDLAAGRTPERTARDFHAFLERAARKLPGTPVVLAAVKPSPARRGLRQEQRDLNLRLRAMAAARPGAFFADTYSPLLDARGEPNPALFREDGLHLNSLGYAAWAEILRPAVAEARAHSR